jgi:hypothetical protein
MDQTNRLVLQRAARALACVSLAACLACSTSSSASHQRTFQTPEEAAKALIDVAKKGGVPDLLAILGPDAKELVDSSNAVTARHNREVFTIAAAEGWKLVDEGTDSKTLVVGHEEWPFPVPIVKGTSGWRFDTAAGTEEVIARRIGRNELAAIHICQTYVTAQHLYAQHGHDGKPAGLFATRFQSDRGKQNGLYWPVKRGEKRSPLGDLVAEAEGHASGAGGQPSPFHGYYFKILTAQGPAASGGAKDYVVNGDLSGGFALVAWPAQYDATGVMTFLVNRDGIVRQKDLGAGTDGVARSMASYNPDESWESVR